MFGPKVSQVAAVVASAAAARLRARELFGLSEATDIAIGENESFLEWCERLAAAGLQVDGRPFDLSNRPALRAIYASIPSTREELYQLRIAVMKGAQTGLTAFTFFLIIYIVLKFMPVKAGAYYPDRSLAGYVSANRFMPVIRTIKPAYSALLGASKGQEGNVLVRKIGKSEVIYLWTSGGTTRKSGGATESFPLDMIVADEVQNMLLEDIAVIMERMSASTLRFFFACSTAKWPEADIHALFNRGNQQHFHTKCRCDDGVILDAIFPDCIVLHDGVRWPGAPIDYVYCCPTCDTYIPDSQDGEWRAHAPDADPLSVSWHYPQTLSPTVSPREMMRSYMEDTNPANFYQRKLGRPYTDPSQVPITLEICERQARAGVEAGLKWKKKAKGTYMGIDQMGSFNVVLIVERMPDGRMALVHTEFIYDLDPFERCSALLEQYGVSICVVEQLPNVNDARRFANQHMGKVFLCTGYRDMGDDMIRWSDQLTLSDRKTADDAVSRYTVTCNQYKTMQAALFRIKNGHALFPDPNGLSQDILEKGVKRHVPILRTVFDHFTKTALVVEQNPETRRPVAKVVKVGIDPHASYAWMLANVAWSREHGMGTIFIPGAMVKENKTTYGHGGVDIAQLPGPVQVMMADIPEGRCGRCTAFDKEAGMCGERGLLVLAEDIACMLYVGL